MSKTYDAKSIKHLPFKEGVKQRVGMYLGSPDNEGVVNALFEIISNSVDEAIVGYGKEITIEVGKTWASVEDHGRGIPRGPTEDDKEVLITLLTESHTGAKFDDDNYTSVRGLNGIGSGATNCSSDYFKVVTKRDGYEWSLEFDKGVPRTEVAKQGEPTKETGTFIYFVPSQEVFSAETIEFDYGYIAKKVKDISYLINDVTFVVINGETKEKAVYYSKNGIVDLLNDSIKNPLHKGVILEKVSDGNSSIEIAMRWNKGSEKFYCYVNGAECPDGGTPLTGTRAAITRIINKELKKNFSGDLVRRGLVYVISCSVKNPLFSNQTKTKIGNAELRTLAEKAVANAWKTFSLKNPTEVEIIKEFLVKEEKAEKAAEKARSAVLANTHEIEIASQKKTYNVEKLKDCIQHGPESTLLICEGKSASGALQTARPIENVALYAIRGKIINAKTNPIEKVLENEEVKDIIKIIGAGFFEKFNEKKMNFGKIGMAVDADAKQHWRKMLFA